MVKVNLSTATTLTRAQLVALVASLGLDPEQTGSISIRPDVWDRVKTTCNAWLGLDLLAYEGDQ